jgi:hypothetical protein
VSALQQRLNGFYHSQMGNLPARKRSPSAMAALSMPDEDYAHIKVDFGKKYFAALCYTCRGVQQRHLKKVLLPRFLVANDGVIKAKARFLRVALRRRCEKVPHGECPKCIPIKRMLLVRLRGSPFPTLAPKVLKSYINAVCAVCREAFIMDTKKRVERRAQMVHVQTALRTCLFRNRVLPALLRLRASATLVSYAAAADAWRFQPGKAVMLHMIVQAARPLANIACLGRCAVLTEACVERLVHLTSARGANAADLEDRLSTIAYKYSRSMCKECRFARRGTLHQEVADYIADALPRLPAHSTPPAMRLIAALLLMVRFVQQRWRWRRLRRSNATKESIVAAHVPPQADEPRTRCARCTAVHEQMRFHVLRSWRPLRQVSAVATRVSNAARSAATGMRTEAGDLVWFAARYEHALCTPNQCREQRLKHISSALKQRRLMVFVMHRWRWRVRYAAQLVTAAIRRAHVRDQFPVCERCAPVLLSFFERRKGISAANTAVKGTKQPWQIAATWDRGVKNHQRVLCTSCQHTLGAVVVAS